MTAFLSLGSCMGDSVALLRRAAALLEAMPLTSPAGRSSLYETAAIDVPDEFRDMKFLNAIVAVETELPPVAISAAAHAIEAALGRVRSGVRHEPRSIDVDIVAIGDIVSADQELTLPHPEAARRLFVMAPLAEIMPGFVLAGQGMSAAEIARSLEGQQVSRLPLDF